jgi:ATP-grasp domain, R2K clade family 2
LDGEVLGIRYYKGDVRLFPDVTVIDRAIAAYTNSPAAYAIDFGIVADGRTLLVETNEAYSLGCYGLPELRYSSLIERRWQELLASR